MAVLLYDSYDHYDDADILKKWPQSLNGAIVTGGAHGNGAQLHEFSYIQAALPASGDTFVMGTYINPGVAGGAQPGFGYAFCVVIDGATAQCYIDWDGSGFIKAYRGNGTLLGTSSAAMSFGIQQFVEAKFKIHSSTGTVEVRINRATVLSLTGQNTQLSGTAQWNAVRMSCGAPTGGRVCIFDDTYILDGTGSKNTFLGPVRAVALFPTGAGASTDFTPSAGSNWQNVDEASQDGDTTYNTATTPGDHDTYQMGNLGITGDIIAVQTNMIVRSDAAGAETVAPMLRVNGTDYQGATVGVSTSYVDKREVFEVSPDTGVDWTVSEVDGTEPGMKLVS